MSEAFEDQESDLIAAVHQLQDIMLPLRDISAIERIKLDPGEVLHIKFSNVVDQEELGYANELFGKMFPDNKFFFSSPGSDITLTAIKDESK